MNPLKMLKLKLNPRDVLTLERLKKKNNTPIVNLTCSSVSSVNLTGIIDKLERKGLVERQPNPEDRRTRLIKLTDKGQLTINQ